MAWVGVFIGKFTVSAIFRNKKSGHKKKVNVNDEDFKEDLNKFTFKFIGINWHQRSFRVEPEKLDKIMNIWLQQKT